MRWRAHVWAAGFSCLGFAAALFGLVRSVPAEGAGGLGGPGGPAGTGTTGTVTAAPVPAPPEGIEPAMPMSAAAAAEATGSAPVQVYVLRRTGDGWTLVPLADVKAGIQPPAPPPVVNRAPYTRTRLS
ncbi:MAG: hypothetical protein IRY95_07230 [Clostridia bacterium]|nr:hypothetical protein [Clostridia bacterium]